MAKKKTETFASQLARRREVIREHRTAARDRVYADVPKPTQLSREERKLETGHRKVK